MPVVDFVLWRDRGNMEDWRLGHLQGPPDWREALGWEHLQMGEAETREKDWAPWALSPES